MSLTDGDSPPPRRPNALPIVHDEPTPCPYLDNRTATLPLRYGVEFSLDEVDVLLDAGFRRSGVFVYETACDGCDACVPTRLDVSEFKLSKSQKRLWKRGESQLQSQWRRPIADAVRTDLFNRHRNERNLNIDPGDLSVDEYETFLVQSCMPSRELSLAVDGRVVGASIMDVGRQSVSAVYTFFSPDIARHSPGTYAVLKQIQWAREHGRRYFYLGFNVASNRHLNYKSRFRPQQRRLDQRWVSVAAPESPDQGALT